MEAPHEQSKLSDARRQLARLSVEKEDYDKQRSGLEKELNSVKRKSYKLEQVRTF